MRRFVIIVCRSGFSLTLLLALLPLGFYAQQTDACVKELKQISASEERLDSVNTGGTFHMKYMVEVTDHEGQRMVSNVTVYKNETCLHLFSEQARLYRDADEALLVLPMQKVAFLSDMGQDKTAESKYADYKEFLRNSFLDSCKVISCETDAEGTKTLIMEVADEKYEGVYIKRITYVFNPLSKVLKSTKTEYSDDYKLKEMKVTYKETERVPNYVFNDCKSYFFDKKNKRLAKYSDYEFEDYRDINVTKTKRK
ncbi:MAG: hypothetical protein QM534_14040 [Sediminibacterium sp.]|nr:hypothetical protein [Sediminibacterium sp.]